MGSGENSVEISWWGDLGVKEPRKARAGFYCLTESAESTKRGGTESVRVMRKEEGI